MRAYVIFMSNPEAAVSWKKRKGPGLSFLTSHRAGDRPQVLSPCRCPGLLLEPLLQEKTDQTGTWVGEE